MWLGEQISERGIGNGISLIIFAGIVVDFPSSLISLFRGLRTGEMDPLKIIFLAALMVAVIAFIVFVERGQRRIPVSYAKRVVGRKVYGGQSTHLPLRVNTGGVIPIIFAASVITIPATLANLIKVPWVQSVAAQFGMGMPLYNLVYVAAIIFFTYFYISIIFNPVDVADNLRKYGGFIPGIRPGKNTSDYIDDVLSRITLVGAIYLAAVAILPEFLITGPQGPGPALDRPLARGQPAALPDRGPGHQLHVRRHVAPDRRRRGHGHHAADRGPAGHAPLRRLHAPQPHPREARMRIILLGAPGSGKGTVAEALRSACGYPKISTGDLLREAVREKSALGLVAASQMGKGALVDDATVLALLNERLARDDCREGYVLDGYPRNLAQAECLDTIGNSGPEIVFDLRGLRRRRPGAPGQPADLPPVRGHLPSRRQAPEDARRLRRLRHGPRAEERRQARGHPGTAQDPRRQDRAPRRPVRGPGRRPRDRRRQTGRDRRPRGPEDRRRRPRASGRGGEVTMITFKSATELEAMRQSGRIVAAVLGELEPLIRPGIRTRDLDLYAEKRTRELGAVPAFKGYRGYPASVCISVNEEVIHGIPSGRILQEGDIVSLDFGVLFEGFYSDSALTAPVGRAGAEALRLIAAAERSFVRGLEQMKEGNRLSDISAAIQESVESEGFSVVRQFVGHGIGRALHEEPPVPNFGPPGAGRRSRPG